MPIICNHDRMYNRRRRRLKTHRIALHEFVAYLHGQSYFSPEPQVVSLSEFDIDEEAIYMWAQIRKRLLERLRAQPEGWRHQTVVPLLYWASEARECVPSSRELIAAHEDLLDAVGLRVALVKRLDQKVKGLTLAD